MSYIKWTIQICHQHVPLFPALWLVWQYPGILNSALRDLYQPWPKHCPVSRETPMIPESLTDAGLSSFLSMHFTTTVTRSISERTALMLCRNSSHPVRLGFKHSSSLHYTFLCFSREQDILNIHYRSHPSCLCVPYDISLTGKANGSDVKIR